ncbi:hypothetical protein [Nafulsella turpanensis]|uniref:hypothetical protein n=1 Tax=Nafulsella turpanensis TaxID=1265690 RepID=UPI00036CF6BE|nr:hypothetical protein [Nafulsella turpanensis]
MERLPGRHNYLICFTFFMVFACTEIPEPEQLDHKNIAFDTANSTVNFCESFPLEWDSALIIHPYMRVESWDDLELENIDPLEERLEIMESIDWKHYLIFVKGSQVVAFSDIPRGYLDFRIMHGTSRPTFITREDCTLKFIDAEGFNTLIIPDI